MLSRIRAVALAIAAALLVPSVSAQTTVHTPVISVPASITVPENIGKLTLPLSKDGPNVDYSEVWVNTSDVGQTAMAGRDFVQFSHNVDFDNNEVSRTFTLTILNRHGTGGNRSFVVKFKSQRFSTVSAPTMTINITSVAPPPPMPPADPVVGPLTAVASQSCSSLWNTPAYQAYRASNPSAPAMPTVTAGKTYTVLYEPGGQQGGLVPNNFTGPFVAASDGTPNSTGGSEFDPSCFPPPPAQAAWVSGPLQDGGFARVKANDADWDMTGPGNGRKLVPGEIVAIYFNGWGNDADNSTSFAVYALQDGTNGRVKASDIEGVMPTTTPPNLPADWWIPGLVTATKTCPNLYHPDQPGVTQGGVYRARMLAGSHMKIAAGQTGASGQAWIVSGSGDLNNQYALAQETVDGACLMGNA